MDQRSDYIRQDIESTRAALDEKLDTLETKAREAFDLKHQVAERPWMMLGAAVATGYVLGSLGGGEPEPRWHGQPMVTNDYTQHVGQTASKPHEPSRGEGLLAQFDDEIDMLKTAAISTLTDFLRSTIREYVPSMGQHLDQAAHDRGLTPTTSPGASMRYGTRTGATNYEGIPETTSYGSNRVARTAEHAEADMAGAVHRPGETERERSVGESTARY
jgi:BMFP domain-containing protein YqiC